MNETKPVPEKTEVSYQVMPGPSGQASFPSHAEPMTSPAPRHSGGGKWVYALIVVIVLLILGAGAYYFLGTGVGTKNKTATTTPAPTSRLAASFLAQYFAQNLDSNGNCNDQTICGDNVDGDHDGLTNYDEMVAGTNPLIADTDGDGLADGDEVNIYKTNPIQKYTDTRDIAVQSDFNDGASIKNGYDPLTPGEKLTSDRLTQIQSDIAKYGLHAPTMATLGLNADGTPAQISANTTPPSATPSATPATTPASTPAPVKVGVAIQNMAFSPATLTVKKGTIVTWTNNDSITHTVTADAGAFASGNLAPSQTFSFTFAQTGTFAYHCSIHPNMTATVIVQ